MGNVVTLDGTPFKAVPDQAANRRQMLAELTPAACRAFAQVLQFGPGYAFTSQELAWEMQTSSGAVGRLLTKLWDQGLVGKISERPPTWMETSSEMDNLYGKGFCHEVVEKGRKCP